MSYIGIIEGFYGKFYTQEQREFLFNFQRLHHNSFYIYAPKNDKSLRLNWADNYTKEFLDYLKKQRDECFKNNLDYGVGISPINLSLTYKENLKVLLNQIEILIDRVNINILAILFDDIKLQSDDVGKIQAYIINQIYQCYGDKLKHIIFCPSYYSFDPILDKIFGQRPKSYYQDLQQLPEKCSIFWTGNKVLSEDISKDDLQRVEKLFSRKIFIWDNYPVNDGKKICKFLFIDRFVGRENLDSYCVGHAINPMLEPYLSTLSMLTLPLIYQQKSSLIIEQLYLEYAHKLLGDKYLEILSYKDLFTKQGLDNITEQQKSNILKLLDDNNCAHNEIKAYLNGEYAFDESCLTS